MGTLTPMGTLVPRGSYVAEGTPTAMGTFVPASSDVPEGYALVYSGGTVMPSGGWTAIGGSLIYMGTEAWADPAITELDTTQTPDLDGAMDIHLLTNLVIFQCFANLITSLILPEPAPLALIDAHSNALTSVTIGDVADTCAVFFGANALPEAQVDGILASLAAGVAVNGTLDITGGTNAPPSATGLTAKATLEGRGWTVTVN